MGVFKKMSSNYQVSCSTAGVTDQIQVFWHLLGDGDYFRAGIIEPRQPAETNPPQNIADV
jgi:hypothetical protein